MTSIIISSNHPELSQMIGQKTTEALDCTHLDQTLLERVAERFEVSKDKLEKALDPVESRRLSATERNLLLAYIETTTLEAFQNAALVCTGLAAHLYIRGVSHILMVRVLGNPDDLAKRTHAADGSASRPGPKTLQRHENRCARWSRDNFGIDELDPSIYDLVLSVGQIEMDKLVQIITDLAGYRKFQPMTYSRNRLNDLWLSSKVLVVLLPENPGIDVRVAGTRAIVHTTCSKREKAATIARIKKAARKVDGIQTVEVHTSSPIRLFRRIRKAARIG